MLAFLMYMLATSVGLFLLYHYKRKKRSPSSNSLSSETSDTSQIFSPVQRKPVKSSILTILGLQEFNEPFYCIEDHFRSFKEVSRACQRAGLETCHIIIGIDFTASNEWQGKRTFSGYSLHRLTSGKSQNPYQKVISILGEVLEPFVKDQLISAYGFGDSQTQGKSVFPFLEGGKFCYGFSEVLECYNEIVQKVVLKGPTSFAPLIRKSIDIVRDRGEYSILIIVADGQISEEPDTIDAIVEASNFPLSIIMVGVGDGPWSTMEKFDNCLPQRSFDNFQFVNYHRVTSRSKSPEMVFALHALMEIPDQYKTIKSLGYLKQS